MFGSELRGIAAFAGLLLPPTMTPVLRRDGPPRVDPDARCVPRHRMTDKQFTDAHAIAQLARPDSGCNGSTLDRIDRRESTDRALAALLLTAMVALIVSVSRLNPLWLLLAGGLLGFAGIV
jgi:hypothetical protein